ncbi:MAG TPA: hypothetical protein VG271_05495 [Beijerinckiaceae bacterium]|nr:hypothetical protein [Beijerinckiaceae bacterium]
MNPHLPRLLAILLCAIVTNAAAAEDFYKGKQIKIISSSATTYADYSRILAKYMPRYIPGEPTMIVQIMPGASGLTAANYLYASAPRDGTVIAGTHGQIPTEPLLNPGSVHFDANKFSWIGSVTRDTYIGYVWHTSPVQSLEETRTKELLVGGQAVGSMSVDMPILGRDLFGLKFKIITGYTGATETKLALERGEINGHLGTVWSDVKRSNADWLRDKKIKVITQFGFEPHSELPDVPLFLDLARTPEEKQALELMLARQETAKPYFGPPDMPADRLAVLRNAFDATVKDPDYLAEMAANHLIVDRPMGWQEMTALVARLQQTPPGIVDRLKAAFDKFRAGE